MARDQLIIHTAGLHRESAALRGYPAFESAAALRASSS
jgi:hypothetical protein